MKVEVDVDLNKIDYDKIEEAADEIYNLNQGEE